MHMDINNGVKNKNADQNPKQFHRPSIPRSDLLSKCHKHPSLQLETSQADETHTYTGIMQKLVFYKKKLLT